MNTLFIIIGLFALGAIIGMYLLAMVMKNKDTPKAVTFIHGLFVVVALIMLIVYITNHTPAPIESLVLFIIAALGGLVLVYRDIAGKKIPKWLAIVHGLVALTGFAFLLLYTFVR
jgi:peptidoglycan/LPS O-acetylase OafA/YrhL